MSNLSFLDPSDERDVIERDHLLDCIERGIAAANFDAEEIDYALREYGEHSTVIVNGTNYSAAACAGCPLLTVGVIDRDGELTEYAEGLGVTDPQVAAFISTFDAYVDTDHGIKNMVCLVKDD